MPASGRSGWGVELVLAVDRRTRRPEKGESGVEGGEVGMVAIPTQGVIAAGRRCLNEAPTAHSGSHSYRTVVRAREVHSLPELQPRGLRESRALLVVEPGSHGCDSLKQGGSPAGRLSAASTSSLATEGPDPLDFPRD